jgi:hypothetical protein
MKKLLIIFGGIFLNWYLMYQNQIEIFNKTLDFWNFMEGVYVMIFVLLFSIVVSYSNKKHKQKGMRNNNPNINNKEISIEEKIIQNSNILKSKQIPDFCQHCKSPNSKKMEVCEWCGNQII